MISETADKYVFNRLHWGDLCKKKQDNKGPSLEIACTLVSLMFFDKSKYLKLLACNRRLFFLFLFLFSA